MKKFLSYACALFLGFAMLSSCSSDDNEGGGGKNNGGGTIVPEKGMTLMNLSGLVITEDGSTINGVTVTTGSISVRTNANGLFVFNQVKIVDGRTVVRFSKPGYVDVVRSLKQADGDSWRVVMCLDNGGVSTKMYCDAASGGTVSVTDNTTSSSASVELPADGFVTASDGKEYKGNVLATITYLDPNNASFSDMMPGGDLHALRLDGSEAELVSYGMVNVDLRDDAGNKLQLKSGAEATVTFDAPAGLEMKDEMPLWYFDEEKGVWVEEGVATYQDGKYVGKVKHFSWWNLDYPYKQGTVKGTVTDEDGNKIPNMLVHVGQRTCLTDKNGNYEQIVPANTDFDVFVDGNYYGDYQYETCTKKVTALEPYETRTCDINLPRIYNISGKVVNTDGKPIMSTVRLFYGTGSKCIVTGTDGSFCIYIPVGFKGEANVTVANAVGGSKDIALDIEGNKNIDLGKVVFAATPGTTDSGTNAFTIVYEDGKKETLKLPSLVAIIYGDPSDPTTACNVSIQTLDQYNGKYNEVDMQFFMDISGVFFDTGACDRCFVEAFQHKEGGININGDNYSLSNMKISGKTLTFDITGVFETWNDAGKTFTATLAGNIKAEIVPQRV